MHAFVRLDKLCRHIHLPVQSGANRVLKRMNRRYTREAYLEKVHTLRTICPDIAITSDIIVGFPGESDSEFQDTLNLIQRVEFDGLFAFVYSDRPNAPAARFDLKVNEEVKKERLQAVLALQEEITHRKHQALVGTSCEVLVDGLSASASLELNETEQWTGRTTGNKIVHFAYPFDQVRNKQGLTGRIMNIMIEKALPHCLWGRLESTSNSAE
jgi:tRNA-2-methylthio-N6-dimethylallyladenosine synthase